MKKIFVMAALLMAGICVQAQIEGLKVQGYIQAQAEMSGKDGSTRCGDAYSQAKDGNGDTYWRYGIRRWRFRTIYTKGIAKGVFELNINEAGVQPLLAYLQVDPLDWMSIQAGVINDYFGDELMYPSNKIESLERTNLTLNMFPSEHDLGMKITLKVPQTSQFAGLKLDLGLVSGNAINKSPDGRVNFLGHLKYDHKTKSDLTYGVGCSYYRGTTNNASNTWYEVVGGNWTAQTVAANKKNKREYFGVDAQLKFFTDWGVSNFRGEFQWGTQPSQFTSMTAPKANTYNTANPFNYNRKFIGWHIYYIQDICHTPLAFVFKYAYADNNTDMDVDDIAANTANRTDLSYNNFGFGLKYDFTTYLRGSAFYDMYKNETNSIIDDYKDDRLTIRLQYRF